MIDHLQTSVAELAEADLSVLKAVVNSSPVVSLLLRLGGEIVHANRRAGRVLLRMPAEEAPRRNMRDCLCAEACDVGDAMGRRLARSGRTEFHVSMFRGMYMLGSCMPVHVPGEGTLFLMQMTPGNAAQAPAMHHPEDVEGELIQWAAADLGPLSVLTRRELAVARAMAQGGTITDVAVGLGVDESAALRVVERIGFKTQWGNASGVQAHAYASGLHLFEEDYYRGVVLAAARE